MWQGGSYPTWLGSSFCRGGWCGFVAKRGCYPGYGKGLKEEVECLMKLLGHVFEHQTWDSVRSGGLVIGGAGVA